MEANIKTRLLKSIGNVYETAKGSKLENSLFDKIENDLIELSEYFKVSKTQSFILAHVFVLNYKGDSVDVNDLVEYFECNPMKVLELSDDIKSLHVMDFLKKHKSKHRFKVALTNDQFAINEKITEAILNNLPMPEIEKEQFLNIADVLEKLYFYGKQRDDDEITTAELLAQTKSIIETNLHFPLIQIVHQLNLHAYDSYLFLYIIWKNMTGYEKIDIERATNGMFDNAANKVIYVQKILSLNNELIKLNLIEIEEAHFFNDTVLKLTDKSLKMLQEDGIKLFVNKKKKNNIIEPSLIIQKDLFFNSEERTQLDLLKKLLEDSKLKETQQRLQEKKLPKGITVLLYGSPGTGKTESVYQIAKETNREIVRVDISQSKSMWFGESEKIIKRIFTDYKDYAKQCELTPILLFNEADAIISKRTESTSSRVDQTENTIQNIILEELENFEGIFFATTNLANNLDSAFERRFLFKIEFMKPNISVKAQIWQSKLKNLITSEYEILANLFDFSGGQIENIVRKSEMYEIINGISVSIKEVIEFCKVEQLSKNHIKVGFTKN